MNVEAFVASGMHRRLDGWWSMDVTLRWIGIPDLPIPLYPPLPGTNAMISRVYAMIDSVPILLVR